MKDRGIKTTEEKREINPRDKIRPLSISSDMTGAILGSDKVLDDHSSKGGGRRFNASGLKRGGNIQGGVGTRKNCRTTCYFTP